MIGIYKIISPENIIYIGKSTDIEKRLKQHKSNSKNKGLKESITKYGWENHKTEIILECEEFELTKKEIDIISKHKKKFKMFNTEYHETGGGRKRKFNFPAKVKGFLVRLDYENEMTEEINKVQEKYKELPLKQS